MKIIFLILLLSATCKSQVLTSKAQSLQKENLQQFHAIETFAFNKWKTNDSRQIRELNLQIEAYLEVKKLIKTDFRRNEKCIKAIKMHSGNSKRENPLHNPTIDWRKVLFELRSWINHNFTP